MTALIELTAQEQETLRFAPLWTFTAVAGIDQKIDEKEVEALGKEVMEAPLFKNALMRDVMLAIGSDLANIMAAYAKDTRNINQGLRDVADILDRKVPPDDARGFKMAVIGVGQQIAQASGSWFGDKTSDQEKAALVAVATALRFS